MDELSYFAMRYVRTPPAFLEDSIFTPPLLPRTLTRPRTRVRLPPRDGHDLDKTYAPGALHHREDRSLLAAGLATLDTGIDCFVRFAGLVSLRGLCRLSRFGSLS